MQEDTTSRPGRALRSAAWPLACLLAAACVAGEPSASGTSEPSRQEPPEASQIFAADEAFNRATQELGVAGWVDFFAPDGRMVASGGEIVGKAAIREAMEPYLSSVKLEWSPTRAVARAGGELGYTVGRFRASPREDTDSLIATGTYVTIWERQADGNWKVALDVGSFDTQPRP